MSLWVGDKDSMESRMKRRLGAGASPDRSKCGRDKRQGHGNSGRVLLHEKGKVLFLPFFFIFLFTFFSIPTIRTAIKTSPFYSSKRDRNKHCYISSLYSISKDRNKHFCYIFSFNSNSKNNNKYFYTFFYF